MSSDATSCVASKVPFGELCGLLEKVSRTRGNDRKKSVLKRFIEDWRTTHSKLHAVVGGGTVTQPDSFFPAMRLLLPQCDKARVAYGIKEHTLAKLYISILGLGKESPDALKLLNYKSPKHARGSAGDFAEVAYFILKNRSPEKGTMTVKDVDDYLTGIAESNSTKQKNEMDRCLLHLLRHTSALEQKWLIRIIMKELRCGLSQASVLTCFHPDAEALFDVTQDLNKVCEQLHDPGKRLHEVAIGLFLPFRPMLGDRCDPSRVTEQIGAGRTFLIETKFDGERVQLHKDGDHYRYWSRNGNEWTASYGGSGTAGAGSLTPHIHRCFRPEVRSCILDGEMMGFNAEIGAMGSKTDQFDIKRPGVVQSTGYHPCFIVFDLVFLNGEVLTNRPLSERKGLLTSVLDPIEGRILISEWRESSSSVDIVRALNEAIDTREEGIVVKATDSIYAVSRRKAGWWKLKPDYLVGLQDDLDCLIVGGYFGSGHRSGLVAQFLCAVRDEEEGRFHTVCRVATGYSKQTLAECNVALAPHWKPFDKARPPGHLVLGSERPDLWIEPGQSLVVQIRAAEFMNSNSFSLGFTLRFPRVETFRDDKSWRDCTSLQEIREMRDKNQGKLASRHLTLSEGEDEGEGSEDGAGTTHRTSKRARRGGTVAARVGQRQPAVPSHFLPGVDASTVCAVSSLLSGKEVCILVSAAPSVTESGSSRTKAQLERLVLEAGGTVVQNPGRHTYCLVTDRVNLKVNNLIKADSCDIVRPGWLVRSVSTGHLLPWQSGGEQDEDVIHLTSRTRERLRVAATTGASSEREGGSTTEIESAGESGSTTEIESAGESGSTTEIESSGEVENYVDAVERKYRKAESSTSAPAPPLTGCHIHLVPGASDPPTWFEQLTRDLSLLGARLETSLSPAVITHVLVGPAAQTDSALIDRLRQANHNRPSGHFLLVSDNWAKDCIAEGSWRPERLHLL